MGGSVRLSKRELRRQLLAERRRRGPGETSSISVAVCARVLSLSAFRESTHVVPYAARADELDPSELVEAARAAGKFVYFPRIVGSRLEFLESVPQDLRPGEWGVLEPGSGRPLDLGAPETLFLVPGLAFDPTTGGRLGRGGGHYDRALADHPSGLRLGLAAEASLLPGLPSDPWDQPMDGVVTEDRLLWLGGRLRSAFKENLT